MQEGSGNSRRRRVLPFESAVELMLYTQPNDSERNKLHSTKMKDGRNEDKDLVSWSQISLLNSIAVFETVRTYQLKKIKACGSGREKHAAMRPKAIENHNNIKSTRIEVSHEASGVCSTKRVKW